MLPVPKETIEQGLALYAQMMALMERGDYNAQFSEYDLQVLLVTSARRLLVIAQREAKLRVAVEALGCMPNGLCFCSKDREPDKAVHEPECAELRACFSEAP